MSWKKNICECLCEGYFFNARIIGIKRVRTLMASWVDEHTQDKRVTFLFSRKGSQVNLPSPRDFAIHMGTLGWWTCDSLCRTELEGYRKKIEETRARFLARLGNPYFLKRLEEIANIHNVDPKELLESIKFSLPARKIRIEDANESQIEEMTKHYASDMDRRILNVAKQIKILLTKGIMGRKQRIETLIKTFATLQMLNVAEYRSDLIQNLSKAFGSIEVLDRRNFPNDLDKYLMDETLSKPIKIEIMAVVEAAQNRENWRLR